MHIIRQRSTIPRFPPRAKEPGYYRHDSYYVGPKNLAVVENEKFDVHLLYLPVGSSSSAFHCPPVAEQLGLVLRGRFLEWDPYGNEWLLEPFDALYKIGYPYNYRNGGREDVWVLSIQAPANTPPGIYYDEVSPPSKEEMKSKGMAGVIRIVRFKDVSPVAEPLGERGSSLPVFSYVGRKKESVVQSNLVELSVVHIPVGASDPCVHYKPNASVFLMPINGRVLLSSSDSTMEIEPFDGVLLREHPYSLRNVGLEDTWICSISSDPISGELYK